jgi:hypothetical protein
LDEHIDIVSMFVSALVSVSDPVEPWEQSTSVMTYMSKVWDGVEGSLLVSGLRREA